MRYQLTILHWLSLAQAISRECQNTIAHFKS
jgi:hypothetical protein